MAIYSILVFFVVSILLVLHSAASCPSSIKCKNLEPLKFPFTNASHDPCGLCTVRCDDPFPRVMLGLDGKSFQVSGFTDDTIKINDTQLKGLIDSKNCSLFSYFDFRSTYSISFTITQSFTLFKCVTDRGELKQQEDKYFNGYYSYIGKGCPGETVYHRHPNHQVQLPTPGSTHPSNCRAYQLPMLPSVENRDPSDAFSLLASSFSIGFQVSEECNKCHVDGGRCSRDTPEFKCLDKRGGRSYNLALILGTAAAIANGIFVIVLFCIKRKLARSDSIGFWKHKTESHRKIEAFLKNCGSLSPKRYTYSDVKKMTNSFRIKLGQGGYGCVFKGKLENGSFVAVKVLKGLKGNGEEFINEVVTISRTSHVNIVTLLGFCFDGCHRALIYEFMPNGSLDKFIHDGGSSTYRHLDWEALYRIVVGIARGLEYLHRGCNTRILHFDIKPHNILLTEDFCPKISDFGLAKLCPQKESIISLMGARGTVGYIAPEVFNRNFGGVSHKSDVYSYGMMIIEMVGGRKNTSVEVDHTSEIYFPHWIYKRLELDEELRLHGITNDEANDNLRKMNIVGLWCIQTDPCHRPSMSRVLEMLEGSTESLQIPPKPFLASPLRPPTDSSTTLVSQHCDNA